MKFPVITVLILFLWGSSHAAEKSREELIVEESKAVFEKNLKIAAEFYVLKEGEGLREITTQVLESTLIGDSIKERIIASGRRFFLFKYPSDGFEVKGTISFVPDPSANPLLIFLRGGNRIFGLMPPANNFTCMRNYTVVMTTYRGGVSEGEDQFGGNEVNDVPHLMEYLPHLAYELQIELHPKSIFMLGASRGGMEMFLALGRSPLLQHQITKAASLSGLLDMQECILYREDMRKMFIRDFGLVPGRNEEEWIASRNPIEVAPYLRKDLPFLILQGTCDMRVSLHEGNHMVEKLKENGNRVDYLEISGGEHCLGNVPNRIELIADWFEK